MKVFHYVNVNTTDPGKTTASRFDGFFLVVPPRFLEIVLLGFALSSLLADKKKRANKTERGPNLHGGGEKKKKKKECQRLGKQGNIQRSRKSEGAGESPSSDVYRTTVAFKNERSKVRILSLSKGMWGEKSSLD